MVIGFALLNIESPFTEQTAVNLNGNWQPHFNTFGYEGDWNVLPLRSPGGNAENIFAELINDTAYADTPYLNNYPEIKQLLDALPCEVMSARLLNLKAGAIIKPHRDNELAFEKGEARLHFPIITNADVEFYVNDTRVNMLPGQCWYINANLTHHVANHGQTDRIHLVIDCKVNHWLSTIFNQAQKTEFEDNIDTEHILKVIEALRNQQTETAAKLAHELEQKLKTNLLI